MKIKLLTFAKLTLILDVIDKRTDGYHNVKILLHNINLSDFMSINLIPYPYFILETNLHIPPKENLIYKGYKAFIKETGIKIGCKIFLHKRIPKEAGLGGGSSNAAGIIYGLNILTKANLSLEEMANIGKFLGSDIPFFFYGGSSVAEGRGEIIKKIKHQRLKFLLIFPPFGISTKEVYSKISKDLLGNHIAFEQKVSEYTNGIYIKPYNFLEKITFNMYPELAMIKKEIEKVTEYVSMTGSGSTIFVMLKDKEEAKKILERLNKYIEKGYKIKLVDSAEQGIKILR
uniref:4-diphosphocytidyl-2-C-methyl-D-erythritol kinase n=1 Tax=Dictyoglomus thermophilum TaxID=14 RepID=A0A7C3MJG2_DICTH